MTFLSLINEKFRFMLSNNHISYPRMITYLKHKNSKQYGSTLDLSHLDDCRQCWNTWNKARWDLSKNKKGMNELKDYLGNGFVDYFDSSWALASEWESKSPLTDEEVIKFYKHTSNYLYNLVIWYESGDRENFKVYFDLLRDRFKVRSIVDYGCGVGNDGLDFLDYGFKVKFVDFDCPSVDFLKWRGRKRGYRIDFQDIEKTQKLPPFDALWAIDVLEHMTDPLEVVNNLSDKTRVFIHRSQFNNKAKGRHPFHFNFEERRLNNALKGKGFKYYSDKDKLLKIWFR